MRVLIENTVLNGKASMRGPGGLPLQTLGGSMTIYNPTGPG